MSLSMREQEEAQLLLVVEDLLGRFYQSHTSSEEKKKLEAELHDLRTTRFNWQYCLDNLDKFHNQYLWFFGSSTVEAVLSRWSSLSASETEYLRLGLLKLLTNYTAATPALHREKVAQILAVVASFQFPTDYPEYIEHILQLLQERFPIGLVLARALGDSVTQKKYVVSLQWQERFKAAVTPHIPDILRTLEPYFAYYLVSVVEPRNAGEMPTSIEQYTNELLQMLQQYFGWIEMQGVEPTLAEALLQMSRLRPSTDQTVVPVSALAALTELYYRQQLLAPATSKQIVLGVKELLQQPGLPSAEELYQDKMSDLVRLCAKRELTAKHALDWEPFLESFYQYTVNMRILQLFYEHLDTWIVIYQVASDKQVSCTDPAIHRLLSEVFPLKLSTLTMERMLHPNEGWHDYLAMCDLDASDEEISELQKYYNVGLELVENIAYFAPQRMYEAVLSPLATSDDSPYRRGLHMLHTIAIRPDIVVPDASKCFTDFIPACQMVARLGTLLHDRVPAIVSAVRWLLQEQLELFTLLADCLQPLDRFYRWQGEPQKMIVATAQTMNTFRSLLTQIEPIKGTSACHEPPAFTEQQLKRLITQLTKILQTAEQQQPTEWRLLMKEFASVLLHVAFGELLKPRCVYEHLDEAFLACNIFAHEAPTRQMIRQAVINPLLTKWDADSAPDASSAADGQLALRREYLTRYVRTMAQTVLSVEPAAWLLTYDAESQYRTQLQYRLELQDLTELVRCYGYFDTSAKALLASTLRDVIERALYIYTETNGRGLQIPGPVHTPHSQPLPRARESDGEGDDPLPSFCRAVIEVLQVQLGEPFLQQVIRVFLGQARTDAYAMQQHRSLIALLGIFVLIVRQPGNRTLIADIVQLCVGDVLPVALAQAEPRSAETHGRLCIALFELFDAILLHRWRYFVPSHGPAQPHAPSVSNESQYAAILQGYGLVIMNSADSELVHNVIASLRILNERNNLFRAPYFAEHFAARFTHAMLHVLVEAKGDLFHQPLVNLLYELATIDRRKFYDLTVTVCPALQPELRDELCQCTDMPTFERLINQFVGIARATAITLRPLASTAGTTSNNNNNSNNNSNNNNNNSNNNNNNNNNNNSSNSNNNNNSGVGGVQF